MTLWDAVQFWCFAIGVLSTLITLIVLATAVVFHVAEHLDHAIQVRKIRHLPTARGH